MSSEPGHHVPRKSVREEETKTRAPIKNPHENLIAQAREKLSSPVFFECLPMLGMSPRVRLAEIGGVKVVIKHTESNEMQGYLYENLRKSFLRHQLAVRAGKIKPEHYILRSPKVFARIGPYLLMRYVNEYPSTEYAANNEERESTFRARKELISNFEKINGRGFYGPQFSDMMFERGSYRDGKWRIFLPYDHA